MKLHIVWSMVFPVGSIKSREIKYQQLIVFFRKCVTSVAFKSDACLNVMHISRLSVQVFLALILYLTIFEIHFKLIRPCLHDGYLVILHAFLSFYKHLTLTIHNT